MLHRTAARTLYRAAFLGDADTVARVLDERGLTDVDARDKTGMTALLRAVYKDDNADVVRLLLRAGADPNRADIARVTPLIAAVRPGQLECVRLLVEAWAADETVNADGDTPLTNAAAWGATDVVRYLLDRGADPTVPDGVGCMARQLARQQGYDEVANLMDTAICRPVGADPALHRRVGFAHRLPWFGVVGLGIADATRRSKALTLTLSLSRSSGRGDRRVPPTPGLPGDPSPPNRTKCRRVGSAHHVHGGGHSPPDRPKSLT